MRFPNQVRGPDSPPSRGGFSLTELLVASAIALMVMAAVATLFSVFGRGLSESQATVDLTARMRAAAWKLRQDLEGVTCPVRPWLSPDANAGYFEISEGPQRDSTLTFDEAADDAGMPAGTSNLEADTDDILMFTTRALAGRFSGRCGSADRIIESPYAEVAWFCRESAIQPAAGTTVYNLHRRQLLVLGYIGLPEFSGNSIAGAVPAIHQTYDLSLRSEGGRLHPNTLGDLTKRANRFMHATAFPHTLLTDPVDNVRLPREASFSQTDRVWEDVILTNVISFDVRVFDPQATAQISGAATLYPGDPKYRPNEDGTGAAGAYIDLGAAKGGRLAQPVDSKSRLTSPDGVATYDTWSQHYELGSGLNDPAEYLSAPPYPVPLEGVEVRIRCYDPTSKQVRQVTVRQNFRGP
jgi:prepilin-type N-terminal cleavage/methylation domain-containing protein